GCRRSPIPRARCSRSGGPRRRAHPWRRPCTAPRRRPTRCRAQRTPPRPRICELTALVHARELPTPRCVSLGLDGGRIALLLAVLERFAAASFAGRDVYLNVVGGLRLDARAVELAVAHAP